MRGEAAALPSPAEVGGGRLSGMEGHMFQVVQMPTTASSGFDRAKLGSYPAAPRGLKSGAGLLSFEARQSGYTLFVCGCTMKAGLSRHSQLADLPTSDQILPMFTCNRRASSLWLALGNQRPAERDRHCPSAAPTTEASR